MVSGNKSNRIPKVRKRETKTKSRLFRFTQSNYEKLEGLATRYDTDVSKIMDLLVEVTAVPKFETLFDQYISQRFA